MELSESWIRLAEQVDGCWHCHHIVVDESGHARDPRPAARRARREGGAVLASPTLDIFPMTIPSHSDRPVDALVVEHAQGRLRYPLADAVLDYARIPTRFRRPGESGLAVLVYAAERERVDALLDAAQSVGLDVSELTSPAIAFASRLSAHDRAPRLLIATSETTTSIAVVAEAHVLFERLLPIGERDVLARVSKVLEINTRQSRRLLREKRRDAMTGALRDILGPTQIELTREALGCLDYCTSFLHHPSIAEVILTGPLGIVDGLAEAIGDGLSLPVIARAGAEDVAPEYDAAVAAALASREARA